MDSRYWRGAAEDEAMQDDHGFIWLAMLETADADLERRRVLDAGCNRGGFLRLLVDRARIGGGWGYDLAAGAIDDARRLAGNRPLTFETADTVPSGWSRFDAAFSHEVLYVLHDLPMHAAAIFAALEPGASYFATIGVHTASPLMAAWHADNSAVLGLPRLYSLDEVAGAFEGAGFRASVGRLRLRFVQLSHHRSDHRDGTSLADWLDYYTRHKVLFRFTRPSQ